MFSFLPSSGRVSWDDVAPIAMLLDQDCLAVPAYSSSRDSPFQKADPVDNHRAEKPAHAHSIITTRSFLNSGLGLVKTSIEVALFLGT